MAGAMKKKTGKTDEQIKREYPFEAKSRMVVIGCQERDAGIRFRFTDSISPGLQPCDSHLRDLSNGFLEAYDASTAYLQSQGIARLFAAQAATATTTWSDSL